MKYGETVTFEHYGEQLTGRYVGEYGHEMALGKRIVLVDVPDEHGSHQVATDIAKIVRT